MADRQEIVTLGAGCFWCIEAVYLEVEGVLSVVSGYTGGAVDNPTYEAVCSGTTGYAEVAHITFDPDVISYSEILEIFWQTHDPTTLNRQGNDVGTQYRSALYLPSEADLAVALTTRDHYQERLTAAGFPEITTEIRSGVTYYLAETYHQQYLAKNPQGYCGHGGTGVSCPVGLSA